MAKRKKSAFERLSGSQMNRKQRMDLGKRLAGNDPGLTIVHSNAGGIDVGNESHFVAVPPDRDTHPVREFGCWTAELKRMAQWLNTCRIDTVAMQATGVYSIPLYDILSGHGIRVVQVNAQHTSNVPGRKSDVQECQWLMKLHIYGLLRGWFRLEEKMVGVRTIWRLRDRHVKDASRAVQHMQKALTKMNIQLANVISDITGVSGQAIIAAILNGERDPWKLADLKHEMVRASREEVARSLEGNWRDDLLFELRQALDSYHFAHLQMRECDRQLESFLASLPTRTLDMRAQPECAAATAEKIKKARKTRKPKRNEPTVDLKAELKRICGVDLTSIDGIDVIAAQTIISEIGTDMSGFRTGNHFASWLGLTPAKDISGGKIVGSGRKVQNRVAMALRMAATTLLNSKSYLGGRYRHLRRQLPSYAAAIKAMARCLAVLIYRILTHGAAWVDRRAAKFEQRRTELELANLNSRAKAKGFKLVPIPEAI
jgi:transposase